MDDNPIDDEKMFVGEDKTSEDKNEDELDEEEKPSKAEIAQKIKYREKYQAEASKVQQLEKELADLKSMVKKPSDDAEAKAQNYIREQAKAVYEELLTERKKEEERTVNEFKEKVALILEENPDVAEQELLDTIEEFEVEPKVALKILKKSSTTKPKPKMPQAKRAFSEEPKEKPDDSKKTMWQILQEERGKLK